MNENENPEVRMFVRGKDKRVRPMTPTEQRGVNQLIDAHKGGNRRRQPQQPEQSLPQDPSRLLGVTAGVARRQPGMPMPGQEGQAWPQIAAGGGSAMEMLAKLAAVETLFGQGNGMPPMIDTRRAPDPLWDSAAEYEDDYPFQPLRGQAVEPARKGFLERFTTKRRIIVGALAGVAILGGVGYVAISDKNAPAVAVANGDTLVPDAKPSIAANYEPAALQPITVANVSAEVKVSSMWDFKEDGKFVAKDAIGVSDPDDPSFDVTATPALAIVVSADFDPKSKANAIMDVTDKKKKLPQKAIQIDMGKLQVTTTVNPESLKDTTSVKFFEKTEEEQRAVLAQTLDLLDVAAAKINPIYETHKNHLEYQAVALGVQYTLTQPDLRKQLIDDAKANITKGLGLGDPEKYVVTFINDDKFAQAKAVADALIKANKIDTRVVRTVITKEDPPIITATINDMKQA